MNKLQRIILIVSTIIILINLQEGTKAFGSFGNQGNNFSGFGVLFSVAISGIFLFLAFSSKTRNQPPERKP